MEISYKLMTLLKSKKKKEFQSWKEKKKIDLTQEPISLQSNYSLTSSHKL